MQFPNPREAFASKEIGNLKQQGGDVSVFSFRTKHPQSDTLVEERQLHDIPLSFTTPASIFYALFLAIYREELDNVTNINELLQVVFVL